MAWCDRPLSLLGHENDSSPFEAVDVVFCLTWALVFSNRSSGSAIPGSSCCRSELRLIEAELRTAPDEF